MSTEDTTDELTSVNATGVNATSVTVNATSPPPPPPPPPGNITDPDVVWCLVNSTQPPEVWFNSPPPQPPGGYDPPYPVAPPLPPLTAPASTPPPPASPDITLNLTYPPSPPPPMWLQWLPCEDAAPASEADTTLFGTVDYMSFDHQLYAVLVLIALLLVCFRGRITRRWQDSRRRRRVSFDKEVKRYKALTKVKAVFDDMEKRHRAETGDYDSDTSAYYKFKVLGIRPKKAPEQSAKEERALERAIKNLVRPRRRRKRRWGEWFAMKYKLWRARVVLLTWVGWYLKKGAVGAVSSCRIRRGKGDSDSDSDDSAGDGGSSDGDQNGSLSESSDLSDRGGAKDLSAAKKVAGDTSEFQKMFKLTGQSEWEERVLTLVDIDGNGNVDFKEFCVGMGILGSPPDEYLRKADPRHTRFVKKTEDPDFDTNHDLCKFVCSSPRFQDFVFQMLDATGAGFVSRDEILSVVDRFAKYVEFCVLRELRHDLRGERRDRRNAMSREAREAVESRLALEAMETNSMSPGFLGGSHDAIDDATPMSGTCGGILRRIRGTKKVKRRGPPIARSSHHEEDDAPSSGSESAYTESSDVTGSKTDDPTGSTGAGSEVLDERETTPEAPCERMIRDEVQTRLRRQAEGEKNARFFAEEWSAYRPSQDLETGDLQKSNRDELEDLLRMHETRTTVKETETSMDAGKKQEQESDDGVKIPTDEAREVRARAIRRRRQKVANARALVAVAARVLKLEYPNSLTPFHFRKFCAQLPEPFAPAFHVFRTFEHFLRPAAVVLRKVPSLALAKRRARLSAGAWRGEQNPDWFFTPPTGSEFALVKEHETDGVKYVRKISRTVSLQTKSVAQTATRDFDLELGSARRHTQRNDRDPEVLSELANLGVSNAENTRVRRTKMHGRDDPPAAAQVKDGSASIPVTLDGSERGDATKKGDTFFRRKRRFGPRALGRDLSVFVSVQMRLRDLNNLVETGSPNEVACLLAEVSLKAQVVAMRALPALSAARVLNAMSATTRAAVSSGIDPATVALADAMLTNPTPVITAPVTRTPLGEKNSNAEAVPNGSHAFHQTPSETKTSLSTFASQNRARENLAARHDALDTNETFVYMGDVEDGGGWVTENEETGKGIYGSDELV